MPDPFPGPLAREVQDDPYPCYRWMREERPVYFNPEQGYWALSRYSDVIAALRNYADFSSALGVGLAKIHGQTMMTTDPPDHERLRTLVSRAFQQGVVEGLAPKIEAIANELIDAAIERGSFDLMQDFAIPLPIKVIAELLGFDPAYYSDYKRWTQALVGTISSPESPEAQARYASSAGEFFGYLYQVARARLRKPKNDLISLLIQARVEKDALTPEEIGHSCELFLAAGAETTTALIGNAAQALFANPDQAALVINDPALIPSMVEEALRYDSPFQGDFRTMAREVTLHGERIPEGSKVVLLLASANRDPDAFPEAHRFLVTRTPNLHVGFGHGIHYCIGAPLARLESRIAATVLLKRFLRLSPDTDHPAERNYASPMLRELKSFRMQFVLR